MNCKKKLRSISGLIALRVFKLFLENIIYFTCGRSLTICINNIFLTKGLYLQQRLGTKIKKQWFRSTFYLILLSTQYNQSKMVALYLANMIKQNKKHHVVLKNFILLVEFFFFKKILRFLGLQIRATGKLSGKMRRSKFHYKLGKVCLQSLSIGLNYSIALSYTKFGIISIKVWLLHADKYI